MRNASVFPMIVALTLGGCKATPPGGPERSVMVAAKHHVLVGNKSERDPLPDTAETVASGKEAFTLLGRMSRAGRTKHWSSLR